MKKLVEIQQKLKAPKSQTNSFGKYKYRSCEDILEAVKPILGEAFLTLTDEMVEVGGRVYVKAKASLSLGEEHVSVEAYAREAEEKKGMDAAQVTGAASSYARKYALSGLFCIDDNKDSDHTNQGRVEEDLTPISEKQLITLSENIMAAEADEDKFCEYYKVKNIAELPASKYKGAIQLLKSKVKK